MHRSWSSRITPANITAALQLVRELPRVSRGFKKEENKLEREIFHLPLLGGCGGAAPLLPVIPISVHSTSPRSPAARPGPLAGRDFCSSGQCGLASIAVKALRKRKRSRKSYLLYYGF